MRGYVTGTQLRKLGEYYAAIHDNFGLDLMCSLGRLQDSFKRGNHHGNQRAVRKDIRYCSNRKEVKDHGDTASFGQSYQGRGQDIEDVTTSGKSIEETFPSSRPREMWKLRTMISLNRMERGKAPGALWMRLRIYTVSHCHRFHGRCGGAPL